MEYTTGEGLIPTKFDNSASVGGNGDGKIYITISDKRGEGGGSGGIDTPSSKDDNDKKMSWLEYAGLHLGKAIINESMQIAEWGVSTIGNRTGDYVTQRTVNNLVNLTNKGLNLASGIVIGGKAFGPVGAVVGALVTLTAETVNAGLNIISRDIENQKQNYEIEQLRIRSGLNGNTNGSRGTEN